MAAIPPAAGHVSIRMPSPDAAAVGGEEPLPREEGEGGCGDYSDDDSTAISSNCPEKQLARFVRCIVVAEWVGNASGTLALAWATTVLLGGFCSSLNGQDFWFATFMIFVECIRVFSRHYKSDSQYLFGSARALRWISRSSFPRMLGRPQQGNQLVLIMGLCFNLIHKIDYFGFGTQLLKFTITMGLLFVWSRRPQRPQQWQIRAVAIAYLLFAAYTFVHPVLPIALPLERYYDKSQKRRWFLLLYYDALPAIIEAGAVLLLLNMRRHRGLANLTATPWARRLISLAKVISALRLAAELLARCSTDSIPTIINYFLYFNIPITMLVLALGSLQCHDAADSLFGRCTDIILHILFLLHFVVPFPMFYVDLFVPGVSHSAAAGLSFVVMLVWLLIGNMQIPTAVAQIVLSSLRLRKLLSRNHIDYSLQMRHRNRNMVPALQVFYVLALCQGALYIVASFLGLFSSLPRRWLMQRSKFGGKLGAKAIDLYYQHAYVSQIEIGVFGARSTIMSFADFAIESLNSSTSSRDLRVAGLYVLHNILLERRRDCSTQDLILRITSGSGTEVSSTLIGMLPWDADVEDDGYAIRLLAARVTAELASSLRISSIPGMLKPVSSLLKLAENAHAVVLVPNQQERPAPQQIPQQTPQRSSNGGGWRLWACRYWQQMKQGYWSTPEEPPATLLTDQYSSLPVLGMQILEKLARDLDNCVENLKDETANIISMTIGLIGLVTTSDNEQNDALVCSSLEFFRRLATTGETIGAALRQKLWNHHFLLTCLARVLENDRSSSSPHHIWEPAMDVIAKLALDKEAGFEIGRTQVVTERLLQAFLGQHGQTNLYYDLSLRKVSGEALANLAMWGTANCSAILGEPGYQVMSDLTNMLSDDDQRYVAASLLLNLCEHCSVNLLTSHAHASEYLSSAMTTVMEHMMAAKGKQLESLINLASEIGDVMPEAFVRELESQTNSGTELVQKLVYTLNSKKVPSPEYPRMRRVIVKIMISILELCRRTVEKLMEEGMMEQLMESLTKIERSPSRVEEYRVFYGNIGVVLEDGEPMTTLVARAKVLLVHHTS